MLYFSVQKDILVLEDQKLKIIPSPASKAPYQSGLLYPPGQSATHGHLLLLDHQIVTPSQSKQWIPSCEVVTNITGWESLYIEETAHS